LSHERRPAESSRRRSAKDATGVRAALVLLLSACEARVRSGHLKPDFTQAVITQPSLQLDAEVRSGHIILVTRPGIVVDTDDVAVRSGQVKVRAPWGHDVPEVLRIEVTGRVGSGHLIARPPYRTFWQWLTRQPRPYEIAAR